MKILASQSYHAHRRCLMRCYYLEMKYCKLKVKYLMKNVFYKKKDLIKVQMIQIYVEIIQMNVPEVQADPRNTLLIRSNEQKLKDQLEEQKTII